uniref:Contactin associated protein like 3 n=1 Tax=Astyanax mexicanus TaxID=7994 RepID=A0A8B9JYK2_ASTMX
MSNLCSSLFLEGCDGPLVSSLPQSAFRSSSQLSNSHGPGYAKLNRRDGAGGWSPLDSNKYQWLEIDLEQRTEITAVATQGRYGSSDWVTSYLLMFSDTGHNWRQYRQEDSIGAFSGNTNADSVVTYKLQQPVFAQFLRVLPLDWNPNGRVGLRLEAYGCQYKSDVASFDGTSYLLFSFDPPPGPSAKDLLTANFKSVHHSGILIHMEDQHGHALTLELLKGKLFLHLRKGSVSHDSSYFCCLKLLLFFHKISFGGVSAVGAQRDHSKRNFHGCLENLLYNGVNVVELAKEKKVSAVGNLSFTCAEAVEVPLTFASPDSFLQLPWAVSRDSVSLSLQFRTWNRGGLLMTSELQHQAGTLWIYLSDARIRLQIHKAGRIVVDITAGSALNDGQWHSVELSVRRGRLILAADKADTSTTTTSFPVMPANHIFLGGCPGTEGDSGCRNLFSVFQGCMRLVHLDGSLVDLIKVQQMLIGNFSGLQMDLCGIVDRCSPSHCEHGGKCTQSWSTFHCNCSNTGYGGATCHSSVYEASCEAYKHRGNTSGLYYIDVDGSGPIKPQLIYCNMSDKAWMVIQHNNTELTKLRASSGTNQHLAYFNYSADTKQLGAIISRAEHCEQELSYHCKKSRLLNTPDGAPFTWWVGRSGEAHTYWGGAVPDSQQCACGLQEDCVDPEHFCNCDGDLDDWANDSGFISLKEHLPIRLLAVGDISRPGSEAAYRVGPLQCYGDSKYSSYPPYPPYSPYPPYHFIRNTYTDFTSTQSLRCVCIAAPTEVIFSFDVGNGPFEVRVETPEPLNDERWHRVKAERNVKEASLHVDNYPGAVQKAPADGHIHLQLNSQLFVGGTASRQKGFLGCIRSLKLNGKTLDLEERAKITPEVRPGCPGHCRSYGGLCQNRGRCVEKYNGFACDCGASPYSGTFCHKEVSAYFRPGTSVAYTFKEPYELNRNSSSQSSSIYSDLTLKGENVSLSFRTGQAPALLLYVSSYYREYLAVLLNRNGHLDVKYKLQSNRDAEVFQSNARNLANGQLHQVSIRRVSESLSVQVRCTLHTLYEDMKAVFLTGAEGAESGEMDPEIARLNALGFTGCLSVVQFNSIAPLKAALLYPDTSPVIVTGPLTESNCGSSSSSSPYAAETTHLLSDHFGTVGTGQPVVNAISSDSALIGGVIAVVIFVILAALAVMARFLYRRKETCQTPESKGAKPDDSPETPFNTDPTSQSIITDTQKEYFI